MATPTLRTKMKKRTTMMIMEMKMLAKMERTMKMKKNPLRMKPISWMKILISSMTK